MSTPTPAVYTVPEVAALLDMSESKLRGLERRGALPFRSLRNGDHIRYPRADVDEYLGQRPRPAPALFPAFDLTRALYDAEVAAARARLDALLANPPVAEPGRRVAAETAEGRAA